MGNDASGARAAQSRGFTVRYEDVGEGPTIVLVPGSFGSTHMWHDAGYVEPLSASRRVLIVDPLGHGGSDKPHDPIAYTEPGVGLDILAVLDAAQVERASLWGYSRGAWLAAIAATQAPDRISALILGGQPLTTSPDRDPLWLAPLALGDWEGFWPQFIPLSPAVRREFEERNDPLAVAAAFKGARLDERTTDLGAVQSSVLAYCGAEDDPSAMRPTAEVLGVDLAIIEGCGHMAAFRRSDLVIPMVVDHLNRTEA